MFRLISILLFIIVSHSLFACEIMDDNGQVVKLQQPARRIISLAPDLTEILFAINAGKYVVGVVKGSDYPAIAKSIPIVASYNTLNLEAILSLHPDLIVAWTEVPYTDKLKKLSVPVYFSHQKKLNDIPITMQRLACLTGTKSDAKKITKDFLNTLELLHAKFQNKKKVTVFYQVWSKPLMTITSDSWINEIISLCGGENIFAKLKGSAAQVNAESIFQADPQVMMGEGLEMWQQWHQLTAVHELKLYSIDPGLVARAGPRILEGAKIMCKMIDKVRVSTKS